MDKKYYTRGEKEYLLKVARTALEMQLIQRERYEPQTVNQKLWEKRGVFVTLYHGKQLRGCIGSLQAEESVMLAIRDNVLLAARDPRFTPLTQEELKEIKIQVSILSELEKVDLKEIKPGDGVVIKQGTDSATYLPEVWKDLPKKGEFLSSLCQKAGLDESCLENNETEFFKYETITFKEGEV